MNSHHIVRQIKMSGYAIVPDVIPSAAVDGVRGEVIREQKEHDEESRARQEATRAKGHRIGSRGVGVLKQIINYGQSFANELMPALNASV